MGLLFGTGARQSAAAKNLPSSGLIHRLGCRACPLNKEPGIRSPKMVASGSDRPLIYVLGEAPSAAEDREGRQSVGPSGELIWPLIPGRLRSRVRWNNTINCRPPDDRDPEKIELEACRPRVVADIERTQPTAVFGLGAFALMWADKPSGIELWRGRRFPIRVGSHSCWFYPMRRPSFILHTKKNSYHKSDEEIAFEFDIRRAVSEVEAGLPEPIVHTAEFARRGITCVTGRSSGDLAYVLDFLDYASSLDVVGVDYETQNLRPYRKDSVILTRAVSAHDKTVSFAWRHREAGWGADAFNQLERGWIRFLKSRAKKAVHNLAFEIEWDCYFYGEGLARSAPWECTQVQAYVLDERVGDQKPGALALEFVSLQYFGINIKKLTPGLNKQNMAAEPLSKLLPYNGIDAKYHRLCYGAQGERIIREDLVEVYREKLRQVPTVVLTQLKGVPTEPSVTIKLEREYGKKLAEIEARIQELPEAIQFKKMTGAKFNPGSSQDVIVVLRDVLKTRTGQEGTGWSTREPVLTAIGAPITKAVLEYRSAQKLKSTYVDPFMPGSSDLYDDGRLHANFGTTFTETGRLNCVAGWTVLETSLGNIEISKLDLIAIHKDVQIRTHTGRWQNIDAVIRNPPEKMYRLQFDNGAYVDCTERHRLLTPTGWKYVSSIQIGEEACTAKGVQRRGGFGGSTSGILGAFKKLLSYGRKAVCGVSAYLRSYGKAAVYFDWSFTQDNCAVSYMVPPYIRLCYEICFQRPLFTGYEGEPERAPCSQQDIGPGQTTGLSGQRFIYKQDSKERRHESASGYPEFGVLWSTGPFETAVPFYEFNRRGFVSYGGGLAGNTECSSFVQFSRRPWESQRPTLSSVLSFCRFGRQTKKSGKGGGESWPYSLVKESGGDESSFVANEAKYTACSPMVFGIAGRISSIVGLFYSRLERGYRGGRCLPPDGASIRKRSAAGISAFFSRSIGIPYFGYSGERGNEFGDGGDFSSARLIGRTPIGVFPVWDISVAGDRSYVTGGLIHHNCENPNLQNLPTRKAEAKKVRSQVQSAIMASLDAGQIDARMIACGSRDKNYCKALWEDYDIHGEWARRIALRYPDFVGGKKNLSDPDAMKRFRSNQVKNTWVFALFYGAVLRTTAARFRVDESVLKPLYDEFWKQFADVKAWQERLVKQFEDVGYVQLLGGLRRRAPLGRGQIINSPIQGATNRIIMHGMNRLSETGIPVLQPNMQIHDDLTYCFNSMREYEDNIERIIDTMLDCRDFDWVCVPLVVELKDGPTWADLAEVGTFASHKRLGWPIRVKEFT